MTKTFKKLTAAMGIYSALLLSGQANAFSTTFKSEDLAYAFCNSGDYSCSRITKTSFGYQVEYEEAQGPNSGPRRGDGDGDPLDGVG